MNNVLEKLELIGNQRLKDADNLCRKVKETELFFKKYSFPCLYLEIPGRGFIGWNNKKKRLMMKIDQNERPFLEHKINERLENAIYFEMLLSEIVEQNWK